MQFKVPQNVQREDKIIGPLTLKQMIVLAIGGTIAYAIYISLASRYIWITWLPPVSIIAIITLAFAFVRPLDLSFTKWVLRWIEFSLLPRKRSWQKAQDYLNFTTNTKKEGKTKKSKEEQLEEALNDKKEKIIKLNQFLESEKQNNKIK